METQPPDQAPPLETDESAPFPLWDLIANESSPLGSGSRGSTTPSLDALAVAYGPAGLGVDEAKPFLIAQLGAGKLDEAKLVEKISKSPSLSQQFLVDKLDARTLVKELADLNKQLPAGRRLWRTSTSTR